MSLSANNISVSFGNRKVLHDTGFKALKLGQLTALIGPNAAGKSTLFRSIAGLIKPKTGEVLLDGQALSSLPTQQRLKRICFMPQFFLRPTLHCLSLMWF
jgi:iron complex transport system ATP-binding protein